MSYPISGLVKSYKAKDYEVDHPLVVSKKFILFRTQHAVSLLQLNLKIAFSKLSSSGDNFHDTLPKSALKGIDILEGNNTFIAVCVMFLFVSLMVCP